jgi:hypothetical protein
MELESDQGMVCVCDVMKAAKVRGPHATPKGLRHGFGIKAITYGVPLKHAAAVVRARAAFDDILHIRRCNGAGEAAASRSYVAVKAESATSLLVEDASPVSWGDRCNMMKT